MQRLTALQADEVDGYRTILHPVVGEALARLDYPSNAASATAQHIIGKGSIRKAPYINHTSLRACGLSEAVVEKIESYLPCVNTVRLAITPWIVGIEFCRTQLKIPARLLDAPRFDLLQHLGFTDDDINEANLYCYGYGTARNARFLHLRHRPLFSCGVEISAEARLRMASAVQSFISGDTGVVVHLPLQQSVQHGAEIALSAWRSGLKSLTVVFDPSILAPRQTTATTRRIKASPQSHAQPISAPQTRLRNEKSTSVLAARKTTGFKRSAHKAG